MVQKITLKERELIFQLICEQKPISVIAYQLNRHISTIYRELQRLPRGSYSPLEAHSIAALKVKNSKKREKLQNKELRDHVLEKIYSYWSPEQISKRLPLDYPKKDFMRISHETIYRFIYRMENSQEKEKIIRCLRQRKKKRSSRKRKKGKRTSIPNLTSIWERPKESENRKELGHWEGDLIMGKDHKTAIGTLVERSLRYTLIVPLIKTKDSFTTVMRFAEVFNSLPDYLKKSLTYDRGTEMAWHEMFTYKTGIRVYFADPHAPWQRGTNENTNGLIRQFFPKKTDFSKYSEEDYLMVQEFLNNRPKKVLGYRTPAEELLSLRNK